MTGGIEIFTPMIVKSTEDMPAILLQVYVFVCDECFSMPVDYLTRLVKFFNSRIEDLLINKPSPLAGKNIMNQSKHDLDKK